ncbi:MAG: fructose-1,6-bisphosphate aldolase/phosphatase [Candidatus Saccharicenans sp.]|nr:MAG: fructose 1,6-bisphosphatase [Candidatus Aminicenantes bacterium]HEK84768.1 fructose 1,6-bisphosphatase [Candidatus Aminicenantes bacterium]
MKITISVLKADVGSIGGHLKPSQALLEEIKNFVHHRAKNLLIDYYLSCTGDDIAILCTHTKGPGNPQIHQLAWEAFLAGTEVAKKTGLYGAGQDLLKDSFSGNVKGLGPGVAEMEIEERENEPFIFLAADKTDPGAYNLPFYLAFADPMYCSGLILSPKMSEGFKFRIIDVSYTEKNKVIELNAPEDLYNLAALLRDTEKYVIESIYARHTGNQAVAISTQRLHNIAGKYTGKDDPVALVRVQGEFPATGEVLAPFNIGHYVAGFMRGSHIGPLMPCRLNSTISYFDGPPIVTGAAFSMKGGKLSEPVDVFDHPYWDAVRFQIAQKATEIRRQGFCGPSMLPYSELEYGGVVEKLKELEKRFTTVD